MLNVRSTQYTNSPHAGVVHSHMTGQNCGSCGWQLAWLVQWRSQHLIQSGGREKVLFLIATSTTSHGVVKWKHSPSRGHEQASGGLGASS